MRRALGSYQNRLNQLLIEDDTKETINDEWESVQSMIGKAAYEALGKIKRSFRKKEPRIWNSDIEKAVKKNKK